MPVAAFALAFAGSLLYFSLADGDGSGDAPAPAAAPPDRSAGRRGAPAEGRLVVTFNAAADEPGKGYLARVALDGSVARMLLEPPRRGRLASNAAPAVSPDGTTVAFQRALAGPSRGLPPFVYLMGLDGSGAERRLTRGRAAEVDPAWSPDGTRIAFSREVGGRFDLFASAPGGSALKRLSRTPDADEFSLGWSPDGSRIVFARYERGVEHGSGDLLLANADGTGERLLLGDEHDYSSPAWSPDGRRIALIRDGHLAVMGADGTTPRPLEAVCWPARRRSAAPAGTPPHGSWTDETTRRPPRPVRPA
ncbi:MAG: TolB family protein, partial [Thermoleophilaceae bacterium]